MEKQSYMLALTANVVQSGDIVRIHEGMICIDEEQMVEIQSREEFNQPDKQ